VLGPGGVGGLVAGALARAGTPVLIVARDSTVEAISLRGLAVNSVLLGDFLARPPAVARLAEPTDVLIVATKAAGLSEALERVAVAPKLVLPLLNGLDHVALLRERFAPETVVAGTIRVEADRPEPGVVVHTSKFLRVDMASRYPGIGGRMAALAQTLYRETEVSRELRLKLAEERKAMPHFEAFREGKPSKRDRREIDRLRRRL